MRTTGTPAANVQPMNQSVAIPNLKRNRIMAVGLIKEDLALLQDFAAGKVAQQQYPSLMRDLERLGYVEKIDPTGKLGLTSQGRLAIAHANGW